MFSSFRERKAAMVIAFETTNDLDFMPCLDSFARKSAEETFRKTYPVFETTSLLDELRRTEYARLDEQEQVYLDYTGGGLYAQSQVEEHLKVLSRKVLGNPHSTNPTSQAMTTMVEQTRYMVLKYFNASPDEYVVIFSANATAALKLVGESYPFAPGGRYMLTSDNHNSVNGIREFARAKGALFTYVPIELPDLRVNETQLLWALDQALPGRQNLFAYPVQSNFSSVQHPLEWIDEAHARGWDVLVDCAAFAPTNRMDLSRWHPDFVPLSFYKIFGYPTGAGCLLVRKDALTKLRRPWYAGGTVLFASVLAAQSPGAGFYLKAEQEGFEDGTLNYLTIPAVEIGLKHIERIGMECIHERVQCFTDWLLKNLLSLRHSNGRPVVHVYGPVTTERRGGTIAFNFADPHGMLFDCYAAQEEANYWGISLRSGCFCNPGAREIALSYDREELAACLREKEHLSTEQFLQIIDGRLKQGALRVSVGLVTNFADVFHFTQFARNFVDRAVYSSRAA
jgi:molybdenum cofactor sulfurtransferase